MSSLKVACVGAGYFSQFHYDAWHRLANVDVVAVCDTDRQKAEACAQRFNIPNVYTHVDDIIRHHNVDIIDVITPPSSHIDIVKTCLDAGVNVVCQKPFGLNLSQAQDMVQYADSVKSKLIVHENFRFMPWFREIKKQLNVNAIGQVFNITFRLRPGDGQGADAYLARQPYFQTMPRFMIHETGIHYIDTFRFLLGEIADVSARLRKCNTVIAGEDSGVVTFTLNDNIQAVLDANRCVDHSATNYRRTMGELLVEGEKGCLRVDGEGRVWRRLFTHTDEQEIDYLWRDQHFGGDCVFQTIQHIAGHFVDGTALENEAKEYIRNIVLEEAVYASHEQRRVIETGSSNL